MSGATGYEVKRSPGSETPTAVTGTSHSFGGLTAGLDYTLSVRAKNADGTSVWSSTTASIPTPDGLSVIAATPDSITLAWSAVTGATSYEVKAGADGAITAVTSGRSHEFTGLAPSNSLNFIVPSYETVFGHDRTLYVRGKNATRVFPWRLITARTVGWVHGTAAITTSSTSLTVRSANSTTRDASSQAAAKFKLGPSGTVATVLPTWGAFPMSPPSGSGLSTHTFTGLTPATTYTIAEDNNGVYTLHASPASPTGPGPVVAATTVAKQWNSRWGTFTTAPAAPSDSDLTTEVTPSSIKLSWDAVSGATRYDVKLGADGPAMTVPLAATSYTFTGLDPSTKYRLYVHAWNGGGASEWKSVEATTLSTLPPPPSDSDLTVTEVNPTSIKLSWDAVVGATSYEVKQGATGTETAVSSGTSHTFPNLTADTEYTLYVRGKAGTVAFPWRSITAKTERGSSLGFGTHSSQFPIYVVPTSSSLKVMYRTNGAEFQVKRGEDGTKTSGGGSRAVHPLFTGLTADTEYTLYFRFKDPAFPTAWRSITVKTLPAQFGGIRTTSFGHPGVAFHGSGTESLRISGLGTPGPEDRVPWEGTAVTSTDHYFPIVEVGAGSSMEFAAVEFTYYLRSAASGDADPPVYQWTQYTATTAPPYPTRLSATATSASLTLRWAVVTGATGYRVKLGANGATTTVTGTSHTFDDNLTAGTPYTLYVYAKNQGGNSEWRSITASTTTAPPAPANLSATATSTTITLSWNAVTGATSYDVKQGATGTATAVSSGVSHTFTGLTAGTEYTLYVRAKNSGGNSEWNLLTASTTTGPSTPDAPSKSLATDTTISLSWSSVADAASYEVKIGGGGVNNRQELVPSTSGASHTVIGLTANTEYTLSVRAKNSSGTSSWSPTLTVRTAPPPPTNLRKRQASDNTIDLNWNAVASVTSYEVKIAAAGKADRVETVSLAEGLSYTIGSLDANTEYSLSMRSKNGNDSSGWSGVVKVTTTSPSPTGLRKTSATDTTIIFTWNAAARATGYDVKIIGGGVNNREEQVPSASGTSHTVINLTPNTEYTLYVRSRNSNGASLWSNLRTAIKVTTAVAAPSVLSATATSATITLSWNAVTGATGYEVKQGASGTEKTVTAGATSYPFTDLTPAADYTLYVRAKAGLENYSDWSSPTTARTLPMLTPGILNVTATSTTLTLSWNAVTGATGYEVKRGASGTVKTVTAGTTSHPFTSLTAGTEYTLYVRAKIGSNASAWSSSSVRTLTTATRTP